ncbi:MAG TPA: CCA tRNA nucleotidyltransferase, partial [Euryarchaeota archaeon]|nr:CCA tRNA nucleotidyltransferase [Euryarchaeota archaeon]
MTVEFLKEVKGKYWPDDHDRHLIDIVLPKLMSKINTYIDEHKLEATPMLVGSIAKGTYLHNPDADIFILFDKGMKKERMGEIAVDMGKTVLDHSTVSYAEHPYSKGEYENLKTDIVPAYKISHGSEIISAVDRTPFHTEFVKNSVNEDILEDIRLIKAFSKGIGVYGSDSRVKGFSGYLLELMVIYYGGFLKVLKNASNWKRGIRVEMVPSAKDFDNPLVWIDPVDNGRNVASALSTDNFYLFISACKHYLEKPKKEFFLPRPHDPLNFEQIKRAFEHRRTHAVAVSIDRPDLVDDILYPQMDKALKSIEIGLKSSDFTVYRSIHHAGEKLTFLLEVDQIVLPKVQVHEGPPANHPNSKDFIKRWTNSVETFSKPYLYNSRWQVDVCRKYSTIQEFLQEQIPNMSLGKNLDLLMENG